MLSLGIIGISIIGTQNNYPFLPQSLGIVLFIVFFGLGFGCSVPLRLTLAADYFGRKNFASVVGILNSVGAIFGTFAPLLIGLTKDFTGHYEYAFFVLSLMMILAVPLVLTLKKVDK